MYREYCYDNDFNFYHYTNNKLTKITRKLYKEKTGESDYIINKLRNSRWKYQENDYFFLKNGKWPIDWKLYNLIKFFNENDISTSSCDQDDGYININSIDKILNLFGRENIQCIAEYDKFNFKNKIIISHGYFGGIISFQLRFNDKILKFMYKKLNLKMAKQSEAHKGRRMIHPCKLKELLN